MNTPSDQMYEAWLKATKTHGLDPEGNLPSNDHLAMQEIGLAIGINPEDFRSPLDSLIHDLCGDEDL